MDNDLSTRLWIAGLKLKGIGELIGSRNVDSFAIDETGVHMGVGMIITDLSEEILDASESTEISVSPTRKKKRKKKS